jgi:hypothetical protein
MCLNIVFTNTGNILVHVPGRREFMLCDVCKVRETKVHEMKRGTVISGKKVYPRHFCEECFELVTKKIGAGPPVKKPMVHPQKIIGEKYDRPFES